MTEKELVAILKRAYQNDIERLPNGHALRTAQCPSIPRLLKRRFTEAQEAHIRNCRYCLKVLALDRPLEAVA